MASTKLFMYPAAMVKSTNLEAMETIKLTLLDFKQALGAFIGPVYFFRSKIKAKKVNNGARNILRSSARAKFWDPMSKDMQDIKVTSLANGKTTN
jgi:hypothetical protein